jgi:hypothetical protein
MSLDTVQDYSQIVLRTSPEFLLYLQQLYCMRGIMDGNMELWMGLLVCLCATRNHCIGHPYRAIVLGYHRGLPYRASYRAMIQGFRRRTS